MALSQAEFSQLVTEHADALYRLAFRLVGNAHEAEDVVQDTFRSAWKSREHYRSEQGDRAWLATILRRRVVDRFRRSGWVRLVQSDTLNEVETPAVAPTGETYTDEVQHALNSLPTELRETLLLVVVGELTHQEAADVLGVPLGTVLSRVSRARTRLRSALSALEREK